MGSKDIGSSSSCRDDDSLLQELGCFLEIIEESCGSGQGVSIGLVMRSVWFIDNFNRQTMELRHGTANWPDIQKNKFLSSLTIDFLELSFEADNFIKTLLTSMKNLKEELRGLLDVLLQWTPSWDREKEEEIIVLDKLWRFGWGESFSEQLLKSLCVLLKQHQDIMEKVRQQGASLERKFRKLKWLKKAISTIFAGFFLVASFSSIIAAALHAGPVFAIIAAAATSAASWQPLALWVDELWMKKLNELQQEKVLSTMLHSVEFNKEHVLRDLEPMYSLVNQLKEMLENVDLSELLLMKESLQNELCLTIRSV